MLLCYRWIVNTIRALRRRRHKVPQTLVWELVPYDFRIDWHQ